MAVGGVHHQQIHLGLHQFRRALQVIARGSQGRAHAQAPLLVFAGVRILDLFLNILYGNKSSQIIVLIDHQKFFHAVLVEYLLGFFQGRADGDGDQVFLGHHVFHRQVEAVLKAQVAVGQDAHQLAVLGDGHAGNLVLLHDFERVGDAVLGADGDGIDDHAAFRALHLIHFQRLLGNRHAAMNNADAALLRQGNRQARFRDRVHGGADDGDIQGDIAGSPACGYQLASVKLQICWEPTRHHQKLAPRESDRPT